MESSSLTDSQVLQSSSLDSPSSEPPDVRNWFSSYVYESPNLDSIENFGDSISRKRGFEEDLQIVSEESGSVGEVFGKLGNVTKIDEGKVLQRTWTPLKCTSLVDHCGGQPLGMNQDSWSSQLLLSEPPDVGNWFSSYVYESPTLNPSQEFGCCESQITGLDDRIEETIEETLENVRKTKNGEGGQLNLFLKCNANSRGNRQDNQPLRESLVPERTTEQEPKEKSLGTNKISPTKEFPISSLTTESLQCNFQDRVSQESGRNSNEDNKKPATHTNLIPKIDIKLENSQTKLNGLPAKTHVPSVLLTNRNVIDLSKTKENKEKRVSEDGFVTANKCEFPRATCKKSVERQEKLNSKETGSGFACLSRKPLSDKTNVEHSDIVEIIGKWSCPQKSKPNLGPPLKQLRLERWIHKK